MKKLTVILLVLAVLVVAVSCGKKAATTTTAAPAATTTTAAPAATTAAAPAKPSTYVRAEDEAIFQSILGDYEAMMDKAAAERFQEIRPLCSGRGSSP